VLAVEDDPADCWLFPVALAAGAVDSDTVVVAAVAVGAAALFSAEAPGAAATADAVLDAALLVVGADAEVVPASGAPACVALVLAVASVFWPVALVAPAVVCDELAD
jgi:hypothetical protein